MKKKLLLLATLLITQFAISQTTLYSENFETGNSFLLNSSDLGASTAYNTWLMNNNYSGGSGTFICLGFSFGFTVANTPTQPAAITGAPNSNYMHITAQAAISSGITNASFITADGTCATAETYFSKMTAPISTIGFSNISFNFWWLNDGNPEAYGEMYYSLDNGVTWVLKQTGLYNAANWTQLSLNDATWDNKPSLLFAFRFVNNITSATADTSFSIDEISVIADNTLSISENELSSTFKMYPNPASTILKVESKTDTTFSIINQLGQEVKQFKIVGNIINEINVENLPKGLYFIKTSQSKYCKKIIIE